MGCNCGKKSVSTQPKKIIKSRPKRDDEKKMRRIIRRVAK